eukprot:gene12750-biopygen439
MDSRTTHAIARFAVGRGRGRPLRAWRAGWDGVKMRRDGLGWDGMGRDGIGGTGRDAAAPKGGGRAPPDRASFGRTPVTEGGVVKHPKSL